MLVADTRRSAHLAYHMGDGVANLIVPHSAIDLRAREQARVALHQMWAVEDEFAAAFEREHGFPLRLSKRARRYSRVWVTRLMPS